MHGNRRRLLGRDHATTGNPSVLRSFAGRYETPGTYTQLSVGGGSYFVTLR